MSYKFNESRRHKIKKALYKVTNWAGYNDALRNRGDITIWFTQDAVDKWRPAKTGARGRPQEYSDQAIESAILIRQVFSLPPRQTEGFMTSIARLMGAAIELPDFSCISKRSVDLPAISLTGALQPGSVVIVRQHRTEGLWQRRVAPRKTRGAPGANCTWPLTNAIDAKVQAHLRQHDESEPFLSKKLRRGSVRLQ